MVVCRIESIESCNNANGFIKRETAAPAGTVCTDDAKDDGDDDDDDDDDETAVAADDDAVTCDLRCLIANCSAIGVWFETAHAADTEMPTLAASAGNRTPIPSLSLISSELGTSFVIPCVVIQL